MTIDELRAMLDQAEKELGGDTEVVVRDDGCHSHMRIKEQLMLG